MAMDDLFKALDMAKQGFQQFAANDATSQAQDQIQGLAADHANQMAILQGQQSQLDQDEAKGLDSRIVDQRQRAIDRSVVEAQRGHIENLSNVGNSLSMRLTGIGKSPLEIAQAVHGLLPGASESEQSLSSREMEAMKATNSMEPLREHMQTLQNIAALHAKAALGKTDRKDFENAVGGFQKMPEIAPILKNQPVLDDAIQKVDSNQGQFGATAMVNLAKLGLIRGAAGRVNEKEIEGADESQSIRNKIWKRLGLEVTGEVPQDVQTFWSKVLKQSKANNDAALARAADSYAGSFPNIDKTALLNSVQLRHNIKPSGSFNPNQSKIDAARAILSKPSNRQDPNLAPKLQLLQQKMREWGATPEEINF